MKTVLQSIKTLESGCTSAIKHIHFILNANHFTVTSWLNPSHNPVTSILREILPLWRRCVCRCNKKKLLRKTENIVLKYERISFRISFCFDIHTLRGSTAFLWSGKHCHCWSSYYLVEEYQLYAFFLNPPPPATNHYCPTTPISNHH